MSWVRMGLAVVAVTASGGGFFLSSSSAAELPDETVCVYVAVEKAGGPGTTVSTHAIGSTCPTMPPTNTSVPCSGSGQGAYGKAPENGQANLEARVCVMGL